MPARSLPLFWTFRREGRERFSSGVSIRARDLLLDRPDVSDDALAALARAAGLQTEWIDVSGHRRIVQPQTLRVVLSELGLPADSQSDIAESQQRLMVRHSPTLFIAHPGDKILLCEARALTVHFDDGTTAIPEMTSNNEGTLLTVPEKPGYHRIETDIGHCMMAVAPTRCFTIADLAPSKRLTGLAVQIYALQGGHSAGFGDLAALGDFAEEAAAHGVDAVAISPMHALFLAAPEHMSPYSPSTRVFFNPLYADAALAGGDVTKHNDTGGFVDWRRANGEKVEALRAAFSRFRTSAPPADFISFCGEQGNLLIRHAQFEALDAHFRAKGLHGWLRWPRPVQDAGSAEVAAFAKENTGAVDFHIFLQWLTAKSLAAAQKRARASGMLIGLISDIAVGMDPSGSHAWSSPGEILTGLSVGAPPDAINQHGQNWGLAALSPATLKQTGYAAFIATLRASMKHAGGVRVDHAMGLGRLWLIPDGASVGEGVYLNYPMDDLLKLIALESHRHRAIVIGEDLGTVPEGFRPTLQQSGIMGMDVLWFQRDGPRFLPPERWSKKAAALTTTHDLPTIAGWWQGRDIDWQQKLEGTSEPYGSSPARIARADDRTQLWSALQQAGSTVDPQPPADDPVPAVKAALDYVARTPNEIAIVPVEDILVLSEQPNIPGTIDEHPNWRRRLPPGDIFASPVAQSNLATLRRARS